MELAVGKHKVVSVSYELRLDDAKGDFIEKTKEDDLLVFLFGAGQMIPAFEQNLQNLKVNETFSFGIASADAYGDINPEAIVDVPKEHFVVDGELQEEVLTIGNILPMRGQDGEVMRAMVVEVAEETVKLDFNHPMAGQNLYFTGKVEAIREAMPKEIEHGHVHNADDTHD